MEITNHMNKTEQPCMQCIVYMQERVYYVYVLIWLFVHFILALKELTNIELAYVIYCLGIFFYRIWIRFICVSVCWFAGSIHFWCLLFLLLTIYRLFVYILRTRVCWPLLCLCRPFCIFERCLDSNPESCRSKQAPLSRFIYRLNPILHTWIGDSCFTCDGSWTIQVSPLLLNIGMVI